MKQISMTRAAATSAALIAVAALAAFTAWPQNAGPAESIKACITWGGAHSEIDHPEYHRITTAEQWRDLWKRHLGKQAEGRVYAELLPPEIDFERFMLVAVFEGQVNQTANVSVETIQEFDDHVRIRFVDWTYAVSFWPPREITKEEHEEFIKSPKDIPLTDEQREQLATTPYGFFLLPKNEKAIVLERQHGGKSAPITWKHAARIERLRS